MGVGEVMRALALFLGLLAVPAAAQDIGFHIDQWGGLNTYNDSARIGDFDATVASNVITDRGFLERRGGSLRIADLSDIGSVKHLMKLRTSDGVDRAIIHVGNYIYSADFGTPETRVSTVASGANVDGVSAFSKFYFTDASQALIEYNGTSTTTVPAAPRARYVDFEHERIWAANIPLESGSLVRASSFGGAGFWTVPANSAAQADAPDAFYFDQDDGTNINCLLKTPFGVFVGKDNKTWVIKGFDNTTWRKVLISENVGCLDDRLVRVHEGRLRWLAKGAFYEWAGAGPPVIFSQDVENIVKTLRQAENLSGTLTTDTQAEFESGNLTASGAGAPISSTIEVGAIRNSSFTVLENSTAAFALGTCAGCAFDGGRRVSHAGVPSANTVSYDANALPDSDGWTLVGGSNVTPTVSGGSLTLTGTGANLGQIYTKATGAGASDNVVAVFRAAANIDGPGTAGTNIGFATLGAADAACIVRISPTNIVYGAGSVATESYTANTYSTFTVILSSAANAVSFWRNGVFITSTTTAGCSKEAAYIGANCVGCTSYATFIDRIHIGTGVASPGTGSIVTVATFTSAIFNSGFSTPTISGFTGSTFPFAGSNLSWSIRSSTSPNNDLWGSYESFDFWKRPRAYHNQYIQYRSTWGAVGLYGASAFDEVGFIVTTTATYRSPVSFVNTAVSGWGNFTATDEFSGGGVPSYYTRASNTAFALNDTSPAWHPQVNLSSVQAPAGQYSQWRVDYALSSGSSTAITRRVQYEYLGDSVGPAAGMVWGRRYFACGSYYDVDDYTCLLYQRNNKFVAISGPSYNALLDFGDYAIAGSSTGYVWKIMVDDLYNDDGQAIESTWVSKDFMMAPNGRDWAVSQKVWKEFWIDAASSSGTLLTTGYALNKSTAVTNMTYPLDLGAWGDAVNRQVQTTDGIPLGKYLRLKLTNAQADKALRVNAFSIYGESNPRRD